MAKNKYESIVAGGGIAGLTAATYLALEGQNVLLIEKNRECGGLVNSFSHNGFQFEAGIRALENAGIILPMLKELDINLDIVKSHVSVGIEGEILHVEDINSLKDYQNLLVKFYPESKSDIDQLIKIIRNIIKHMDVLYGIDNPNFKDLGNKTYILRELLPWLPKFLFTIRKINRMKIPVEDFLNGLIKDPSLRDIISQHFFKNTPSFFALSYFSLYLDYFYPRGGVGKLASAMEKRFLDAGGEIQREKAVVKVDAGDSSLMDQDNNIYSYDNLVWAADLKTFYRITDIEGFSEKIYKRFEKAKSRFLSKRGGDSVFTLFVEVDEPAKSFRKISNGHFFYSPSKQGLGETHREELDRMLEGPASNDKATIFRWLDKYLSLNTYEISIPVLKDEELAPEGKTGIIISLLTEYDLFRMLSEEDWYTEFITRMEDRIISVLARSVYPMLRDKVLHKFSFTPLSYEKRVASSEGAITGWSFQESVPVYNSIQDTAKAVLTPLPNIYQAGQWTYSPAGVPMSVLTGKLAANKILKKKDK